jgi:hypothetical protein
MSRKNRSVKLKPGTRRRVTCWPVAIERHPAHPTITLKFDRRAEQKQVVKDFGLLLTRTLETFDQQEQGANAIKIQMLDEFPGSEPERIRLLALLRRGVRDIKLGHKKRIGPDGTDYLKLYRWRMDWFENRLRPPSNRDIADAMKTVFSIRITREQVKTIRSRDHRDWFYPEWSEKRSIQHQRGPASSNLPHRGRGHGDHRLRSTPA